VTSDWRQAPQRAIFDTLTRIEGCGDWFAVYDLGRGAYALCEPDHYEEVISFLLIGAERALLVDTGMGFVPIRPIVERLTKLPVSVFNTHTHLDHTGGNYEFASVAAFDTPLARARQRDGERASWQSMLALADFRHAPPADVDLSSFSTRPYVIGAWVADGDCIDLGGRVLEVLHTPGHSADSIALLDRKNRMLLTADTFYEGPILLRNTDSDVAAFARSARRMAALMPDVDWLLPSHNAPLAPAWCLPRLADAAGRVAREGLRGMTRFEGFEIVTPDG
jgi:glyoxylase-like metal-dependent hydrolase (beta-lactamase superfamily II)